MLATAVEEPAVLKKISLLRPKNDKDSSSSEMLGAIEIAYHWWCCIIGYKWL